MEPAQSLVIEVADKVGMRLQFADGFSLTASDPHALLRKHPDGRFAGQAWLTPWGFTVLRPEAGPGLGGGWLIDRHAALQAAIAPGPASVPLSPAIQATISDLTDAIGRFLADPVALPNPRRMHRRGPGIRRTQNNPLGGTSPRDTDRYSELNEMTA